MQRRNRTTRLTPRSFDKYLEAFDAFRSATAARYAAYPPTSAMSCSSPMVRGIRAMVVTSVGSSGEGFGICRMVTQY